MAEIFDSRSSFLSRAHSKRSGPIVSVKKWEDVKKVEEVEDCFILEFDPTEVTGNGNGNRRTGTHKKSGPIVLSFGAIKPGWPIGYRLTAHKKVGSMVSVKKREDVKKVEEVEDCFILEFDPTEEDYIDDQFRKFSVNVKSEVFSDDDDDVSILREKGQVACRDYPHPRHLCAMHPFKKTSHLIHCKMCYCYDCDRPAPCEKWTKGCKDTSLMHCDATPDILIWRRRKDLKKQCSPGL